jgi:sugar/nucleoside kinase (ribokinase family)
VKILTIGGATQDIVIWYEDAKTMYLHTKQDIQSFLLLAQGTKVEVNNVLYSTGGGACNTAISFKRLGFSVAIFVKIGTDEAGSFILKKLIEEGITTEHVIITKGQSGRSFVIPSLEGDRTILAFRGLNATISLDEVPLSRLMKYEYLYITSLSGISSQLLIPLVKAAQKNNIPVATNPGASQLSAGAHLLCQALPFMNILMLNKSEAQIFMQSLASSGLVQQLQATKYHTSSSQQLPKLLVTNLDHDGFSLIHFFTTVLAQGPRIIVVTNGADGVYVATHDMLFFHPSLPIKVISALGAGDAFGSTFVGSLVAGKSIEQSIRHGIINSASVIGYTNTQDGLLSMEELERRAMQLDAALLQRFFLF